MATYSHHSTLPLLLLFLTTLALFRSSEAGGIAVYWGRNSSEGSLADTCNTGNYKYVIIAYVSHFGNGQTPALDLADHCNPAGGGCTFLSDEIKTCQARGIKVMLSIGGDTPNYLLVTDDDAEVLSNYLWNNFLNGSSDSRPLGDAVLDGIDFDIQSGYSPSWFRLARLLSDLVIQFDGEILYSLAVQCFIPDVNFNDPNEYSIFKFIWIKFYNSPICYFDGKSYVSYSGIWSYWAENSRALIFLGLPADPAAALTGYVPPDVMKSETLPVVKAFFRSYGGVMLWNRFYDKNYSSVILPNV